MENSLIEVEIVGMSSKSISKHSGLSLHIDLDEEDDTSHNEVNKNDKNEVQEKGKTLLEQTSGESSSPTFLGYLSSPSASATGAHSSYAEKHNRSRKTYEAPLRRLNHLRRRVGLARVARARKG